MTTLVLSSGRLRYMGYEYQYTEKIAERYHVSRETVRRWAREGILPETGNRRGLMGRGQPYEWNPEQLEGWTPPKKGRPGRSEYIRRNNSFGLWTIAQGASETGHSEDALRRWIRLGHLQGYEYGGRVYVRVDDLKTFEPPKRGRPKKSQDISEVVPSEDSWAVPGSEDGSPSEGHSEGELSEGDSEGSWPYPGL